MKPPRLRAGGWVAERWRHRAAQVARAEDFRRELGSYPDGYSPAALLSARADGPDPTGRLVSWAPLTDRKPRAARDDFSK